MFSSGSPDAWDLLWAIPENAIVDPEPVIRKATVVRRIAPSLSGDLPQHVTARGAACAPAASAPGQKEARAPQFRALECGSAPGPSAADYAEHRTEGRATDDGLLAGAADGLQGRCCAGDFADHAAFNAAQQHELRCGGDTPPALAGDAVGAAPTSSAGSLPSCSVESFPERAAGSSTHAPQRTAASVDSSPLAGPSTSRDGGDGDGDKTGEPLPLNIIGAPGRSDSAPAECLPLEPRTSLSTHLTSAASASSHGTFTSTGVVSPVMGGGSRGSTAASENAPVGPHSSDPDQAGRAEATSSSGRLWPAGSARSAGAAEPLPEEEFIAVEVPVPAAAAGAAEVAGGALCAVEGLLPDAAATDLLAGFTASGTAALPAVGRLGAAPPSEAAPALEAAGLLLSATAEPGRVAEAAEGRCVGSALSSPLRSPLARRVPNIGGGAWSPESLRQLCRSRDPRLQPQQRQQHQQWEQEHEERWGSRRVETAVPERQQQEHQQLAEGDAQEGGQIRPQQEAPAEPQMERRASGVLPATRLDGTKPERDETTAAAAATGDARQRQQQPPLPMPPPRRGPTTTSVRLLMRLRPTTALPAGTALARGPGAGVRAWSRAARDADRSATAATAAAAGIGDVYGGTAGSKRRDSSRRSVRSSGAAVALYGNDDGGGASDASNSGYSAGAERVKRRPAADDEVAGAPVRRSSLRTAWRLPPLRGRFDFRTKRRRGSGETAAAAAAAALERGDAAAAERRDCRRRRRRYDGGVAEHAKQSSQSSFDGAEDRDTCTSGAPDSGRKRRRAAAAAAAALPGGVGDPGPTLLQSLESWRAERSRSVRKSPEALLRLGLLADVAACCPTSVLELEDVPGLPRPFIRRFGQEVLDICRNHAHLLAAREAAAAAAAAAAARARRAAAAAAQAGDGEVAPTRGSSGGAAPAMEARQDGDGCGTGGGGPGTAAVWEEENEEWFGTRVVVEDGVAPPPSAKRRRLFSLKRATAGGGAAPLGAQRQQQQQVLHEGEAGGRAADGDEKGGGSGGAGEADGPQARPSLEGPMGQPVDAGTTRARMRQQLLDILGLQEETVVLAEEPPRPAAMQPPGRHKPSTAGCRDSSSGGGCGGDGGCGGGSDPPAEHGDTSPTPAAAFAMKSPPAGSGSGTGIGTAQVMTKAQAAARRLGREVAASPAAVPSTAVPPAPVAANFSAGAGVASARDAATDGAAGAAADDDAATDGGGAADAVPLSKWASGVKRPAGHKAMSGVGRKAQARKLGHGDSPRAAAASVAAVAGWLPPPTGCRVRGSIQFAYADTPSLQGAHIKGLLGILAEAGPTAALLLDIAPPPPPPAAAPPPPDACTVTADAAAAVLPAAAVAAATAAQRLGRTAGAEHLRQLRAMAEAAMPAWEVQRVLACQSLGQVAMPAAVLRLPPGASRDAVRLAFRRLSLLVHPDKNRSPGAAEAFALVNTAATKLLGAPQ